MRGGALSVGFMNPEVGDERHACHVQCEWEEGVCRSCSAHKAGGVEQGAVRCEWAQWLRWQKWHDTRPCPFCTEQVYDSSSGRAVDAGMGSVDEDSSLQGVTVCH